MPKKNDRWYKRYLKWRETIHGKEVYCKARTITIEMVKSGWTHYSAQMIVMTVRHKMNIVAGPDSYGYKISNNYTSYIARELMWENDIPSDFFETRNRVTPSRSDQGVLI